MASYRSVLKSYHINRSLSFNTLDNFQMALIIKRRKRLFPTKKKNKLPIIKDILEKITKSELLKIDDLNVDTEFKIAFASFMRIDKLTDITVELKEDVFKNTRLTRVRHLVCKR